MSMDNPDDLRLDAREPAPPRAGRPRPWLIAGVAGAVALGLVFGLWARPNLPDRKPAAPMQPVRQTPLPVEVAKPVFTPPPEADGKLEVLPADLLRAAPQPPPPVAVPEPPELEVAEEPPPERAPRYAVAPPPPRMEAFERRREPVCVDGTLAERLICENPRLADADRRLNRAYERALRSGVPPRELRAEQRDWLDIREDAARHSPRAVASVYEQRIAELNAIADAGY